MHVSSPCVKWFENANASILFVNQSFNRFHKCLSSNHNAIRWLTDSTEKIEGWQSFSPFSMSARKVNWLKANTATNEDDGNSAPIDIKGHAALVVLSFLNHILIWLLVSFWMSPNSNLSIFFSFQHDWQWQLPGWHHLEPWQLALCSFRAFSSASSPHLHTTSTTSMTSAKTSKAMTSYSHVIRDRLKMSYLTLFPILIARRQHLSWWLTDQNMSTKDFFTQKLWS